MEIDVTGIVIIVGNYGSGKTEVSINLAAMMSRKGVEVRVADLDLVNPYFRTREAKESLSRLGVEVVLPPDEYLRADLPILSPMVAGMIRQPSQLTLLDVGGDGVGATVLAALADPLRGKEPHVIQVVNPFRPFMDSVEGCLKMRDEIEKASKLTVSGIIGNANLIDETTVENVYWGHDFVTKLSREAGLKLEFVAVAKELLPRIDVERLACPVLPINRQLVPPWKKAVGLPRTGPRLRPSDTR